MSELINKTAIEKEIKTIQTEIAEQFQVFISRDYGETVVTMNSNTTGDKVELNIASWTKVLEAATKIENLNDILEIAKRI